MNRPLLSLLACLLSVTACVHRDHRQRLRIHEDLPTSGMPFPLALYQSVGVGLRPGNGVELVQDAQITSTLEEEIRQARESLHLLVSIWKPGEPSDRLLRAIASRQPDVVCRVLVDPLLSPDFRESVQPRLVETGCEVRAYRPLDNAVSLTDERLEARNHRQLVVRDGRSGLTGGTGVGASAAWRDTYVHVRGPAVRQLQQAFARDWLEGGGGLLPESAFPTLESQGEAHAGFVASAGSPSLSHSERMMQVLMAAGRKRLWLTSACFVPTMATLDTLMRKAREGVDVRVLVPGQPANTAPGVLEAQRSLYEQLLDSGIRLFEYQRAPLQARTLLVDARLAAVGSTSLEPNSNAMLEEGALVVEDPALAEALAASFERDLTHAVEVRKSEWKERGWLQRFTYQLPITAVGCR